MVGGLAVGTRKRRQRVCPIEPDPEASIPVKKTDVIGDRGDSSLKLGDLRGEARGRVDQEVNIDCGNVGHRGRDDLPLGLRRPARVVEEGRVQAVVGWIAVTASPVRSARTRVCVVGDAIRVDVGKNARAIDHERVAFGGEANARRVACIEIAGVGKVLTQRTVRTVRRALGRRVDDRGLRWIGAEAVAAADRCDQRRPKPACAGALSFRNHCEIAHIQGKLHYRILRDCVSATSRRHRSTSARRQSEARRTRSAGRKRSNRGRNHRAPRTPRGRHPRGRGTRGRWDTERMSCTSRSARTLRELPRATFRKRAPRARRTV